MGLVWFRRTNAAAFGAVLITASTSRHTRLGVRAHPGGRLFFFKGRGENKSTLCIYWCVFPRTYVCVYYKTRTMLFSSSSSSEFAPVSSGGGGLPLRSLAHDSAAFPPAMTAPHPPRMTNTRCSSFQLPGFIGSFHGYATFGGAFGSDAYARFCWALIPRESEDDASLRKAETPDITCIRCAICALKQ